MHVFTNVQALDVTAAQGDKPVLKKESRPRGFHGGSLLPWQVTSHIFTSRLMPHHLGTWWHQTAGMQKIYSCPRN